MYEFEIIFVEVSKHVLDSLNVIGN